MSFFSPYVDLAHPVDNWVMQGLSSWAAARKVGLGDIVARMRLPTKVPEKWDGVANKQNLMSWRPSTKTWNSWVSVKLGRYPAVLPAVSANHSQKLSPECQRCWQVCTYVWLSWVSISSRVGQDTTPQLSGNGTSPRRSQGATAVTSARFSFLSPSCQELVMLP